MLVLIGSLGSWIAGRFAAWGASALLSPLAPIVTGVAQVIGAIVSAIAEIIGALAKSPEGRVALVLVAVGIVFLYVRFHYYEEGKRDGIASVKPQIVHVAERCAPARGAPRRPSQQTGGFQWPRL